MAEGLATLLLEHAAAEIGAWNMPKIYYRYAGPMTYLNSAKCAKIHEDPNTGHEVLKGQGLQLDKVCISQMVAKDKVCISQKDEGRLSEIVAETQVLN